MEVGSEGEAEQNQALLTEMTEVQKNIEKYFSKHKDAITALSEKALYEEAFTKQADIIRKEEN